MKVDYINNLEEIIEIPYPESYKDCWTLVSSDYLRWRNKRPTFARILLLAMTNHSFKYSFYLRLAKYNGWLFPLFRLRLDALGIKYGLSFSRNVRLGYSFKIVHAIGIVVNATAVIGNNCTIHQFTTIGSDMDKAAVIGDHVYIGPNVCLVENVHVGSYCKIGAGAVVVRNIPSGVTAVGIPAKPVI